MTTGDFAAAVCSCEARCASMRMNITRSKALPGAKGVAPKTAAGLLHKYGTLEEILATGRFKNEADGLSLYRWIATMDKAAPLPALDDQTPTWKKASALAREWELNHLADRLDILASSSR